MGSIGHPQNIHIHKSQITDIRNKRITRSYFDNLKYNEFNITCKKDLTKEEIQMVNKHIKTINLLSL